MGGDGNCLFRAIADQIEGDEKLHHKYRKKAVTYLGENEEFFAPFIEDDETYDQFLNEVAKAGTWGG